MVTRYDWNAWDDFGSIVGGMFPADEGGWVSYADYAALQAENDRLKADRVDLEQFRVAVEAYKFEGECKRLEFCFGPDADKQEAVAQIAEGERLMALIDAHKGE